MRLLLLIFLLGTLATAQSQANSPPNNPPSTRVSAAQPLWELDIGRNEPTTDFPFPNSRVVSDEKRVFYLQAGQLKAVDVKTGQQLWSFRVGNGAQLKYTSGSLLAITEQGKVWALEPPTGRVRWSRAVDEYGVYALAKETLYTAEVGRLRALDLHTGKTKWQTDEPSLGPATPFVVVKDRIFASMSVADTYSDQISIYNAQTGERLGQIPRSPLAILNHQIFSQDNWFLIDRPDDVYLDVHDLRTGRRLESRTYSVENRVKGGNWDGKVAVSSAVYVSGGGNIACFPLEQPGGNAKPDFIKVPQLDVTWVAGPFNETFLLEWRNALWLVRQTAKDSCAPINLPEQGHKVASGKIARVDISGNGFYLILKTGMFYAVNLRTHEIAQKLKFAASTFGPTHVVGDTLIVQAANKLLAFALPQLKP